MDKIEIIFECRLRNPILLKSQLKRLECVNEGWFICCGYGVYVGNYL